MPLGGGFLMVWLQMLHLHALCASEGLSASACQWFVKSLLKWSRNPGSLITCITYCRLSSGSWRLRGSSNSSMGVQQVQGLALAAAMG